MDTKERIAIENAALEQAAVIVDRYIGYGHIAHQIRTLKQAAQAPAISKSMFPSQIEYDAAIAARKEKKR